jgi:stage V sporulation protein G
MNTILKVTHTDVFINKTKLNLKVKATAKIVLNSQLRLSNLKLVEGINGLFVGYPSDSVDDEYNDIFYPLSPDLRTAIDDAVISEYERQLNK